MKHRLFYLLCFVFALALAGCEGGGVVGLTEEELTSNDFSIMNVDGTELDWENVGLDQILAIRVNGDLTGLKIAASCGDEFGQYNVDYNNEVAAAANAALAAGANYQILNIAPVTSLPQRNNCTLSIKDADDKEVASWPFTTACGGEYPVTNQASLACFNYYVMALNSFAGLGVAFLPIDWEFIDDIFFDTFKVVKLSDGLNYLAIGGGKTDSEYDLFEGFRLVGLFMERKFSPGDVKIEMTMVNDALEIPAWSLTVLSLGAANNRPMEEDTVALGAKVLFSMDGDFDGVPTLSNVCTAGYMEKSMAELGFAMVCMLMGGGPATCPVLKGNDIWEIMEDFGFIFADDGSWQPCDLSADKALYKLAYDSASELTSFTREGGYYTFGGEFEAAIFDNSDIMHPGLFYLSLDITGFIEEEKGQDLYPDVKSPTIYVNFRDVKGTVDAD